MSEEFIKEAKNFKRQMKWCSIICWIATFIFMFNFPTKDYDWVIVPFGGIVFTIIYFNMSKNISSYENQSKN